MIEKRLILIVIFAIYFITLGLWGNGCSAQNPDRDPLSPPENPNSQQVPGQITNLPIAFTDALPYGGSTGIGILGLYNVEINTSDLTHKISPLRQNSAIGDSFVVDITNFLSISPCTNCLYISSISISGTGNLVVEFTIRHPFEHGTWDKPPSATNRLDLHIFDVAGVLHFPGTLASFPDSQNVVSRTRLVNADGYSDQFDSRIDSFFPTDATIHPYKIISLDPTEGNFNPSNPYGFEPINAPIGHNVLKMGGTASADFEIAFSGFGTVDFLMVITTAYGQSAIKTTRLEPRYYLPEFNRKEAWKVNVTVAENYLFEGDPLSYCDLNIDVWDWNHGATVDASLSTLDTIRSSSDVEAVYVEVPGVLYTYITATGPLSGDGKTTPLRYTARVFNQSSFPSGSRWGLVKIKDARVPGGNAGGIGDAVDRDGVTFFTLSEFATYQLFNVEIHQAEPICSITIEPNPPIIYPGETVLLDGSESYDFDGSITLYEWDFDYNGSVFTVDATGAIPTPAPPIYDNNHNYNNATKTIALRVTDDNAPTPYKTTCTINVTILPNRAPNADFSTFPEFYAVKRDSTIVFDASSSFDPDGDALTYEWDFNYQNNNFTVDTTGVFMPWVFMQSGCINVALRVSDNGIPNPRTDIKITTINVLPFFELAGEFEIDNTMAARSWSHNTYSCVVATDPNSSDIYVAYYGLTGSSTHRIRVQRSYDGGTTWSTPYVTNNATNQSGQRGIAIIVVPDGIPGSVYVFWIGDGANSSSVTGDGWNIRYNKGIPTPGSNAMWWDTTWNQDITLYSLSGSTPVYKYHQYYYQYSQPLYLAAAADPSIGGVAYIAYSETSSHSYCGESVRLIKTSDIHNYPAATWMPLTITSHVDSATGAVIDFSGTDLAVDSSHNVYVVYDRNVSSELKIRKYPFGQAPGNPAQLIDTSPDYTRISNPRIAIGQNNTPIVVYNNTHFPGGVDGVSDIILSYGLDSNPTMSSPMRVNMESSQASVQRNPDIVIHKECGTIYVAYDDFRDDATYGEIYWTVLNNNFEVIQRDEIINLRDDMHIISDFDVHLGIPNSSSGVNIIAAWEQTADDTWISQAL